MASLRSSTVEPPKGSRILVNVPLSAFFAMPFPNRRVLALKAPLLMRYSSRVNVSLPRMHQPDVSAQRILI